MSIYGADTFSDENFKLNHDAPGLLSMVSVYYNFILNVQTFFIFSTIGKQWCRYQRVSVFYYLCKLQLFGWKTCGVWPCH